MQSPAELEIARTSAAARMHAGEAERYTRWLATHHYENFHVVSWLLPRRLHQHFYNVYAYCRWADDLGDEIADSARALELLDWWEQELRAVLRGPSLASCFCRARAHRFAPLIFPSSPFAIC